MWEIDLNGAGGELAFCKAFNIYPELTYHGPDEYDCITSNAHRIDVKTTRYIDGRLVCVRTKKLGNCDLYVLVTGKMPKYQIVGFATEEELINKTSLKDLGHGPSYVIERNDLHTKWM